MDIYIKLAKDTIKNYLLNHKAIDIPRDLPEELHKKRAGVFICFKNKGELRGCIGTFLPSYANLAEEIVYNTVSAATQDYRFLPIRSKELGNLKITIDVLSEPELVATKQVEKINPKKFGILIKSEDGFKSGLLLPDLEGVDTIEEQIAICCQKAEINPYTENFTVYKFTVERHEEK